MDFSFCRASVDSLPTLRCVYTVRVYQTTSSLAKVQCASERPSHGVILAHYFYLNNWWYQERTKQRLEEAVFLYKP